MRTSKDFSSFLLAVILIGFVLIAIGCRHDSGSEETRQPPSLNTFVTVGLDETSTTMTEP
jgi:hypothetical protein